MDPRHPTSGAENADWMSMAGISQFMGIASLFGALFSRTALNGSNVGLLIMGSLLEIGRRFCQWVMERWRLQYSVTAQFNEGDPAYEWVVQFLTQEGVWRRARDFRVTAASSQRRWTVKPGAENDNADYVPTYQQPQLFRWNGYWLDIQKGTSAYRDSGHGFKAHPDTIRLTIYSMKMSVLSAFVEDARRRYIDVSKPHVTVHLADQSQHYGLTYIWTTVKRKARRPLASVILPEGAIRDLVQDCQEFINTEDWYLEAGIPHRRGYLLYGPPGTGKSSTIYALAGELGLEIYSLSLSANYVDDAFLESAVSSIPKHSIFLIEDIDCAFPSREEEQEQCIAIPGAGMTTSLHRSSVTMSGLLNVLDGVGSEEGKLFFATTNYADRLDPAILRPGRIDRKFEYSLATQEQAACLFTRFFPEKWHPPPESYDSDAPDISKLAEVFSSRIPPGEFSTADLQGYLLGWKKQPQEAADNIAEWIEEERKQKKEREEREFRMKQKLEEMRLKSQQMVASSTAPHPSSRSTDGLEVIMGAEARGDSARSPAASPSPAYTATLKESDVAREVVEIEVEAKQEQESETDASEK